MALDPRKYFEKIEYTPHSTGQWSYHKSKARFRVPVCGRRYGKSTMAGRDLEPKLFVPKKRFWIVGPTYDLGEKEFRVIWDDLIVNQQMGKDKRIKKAYNKRSGDMYIAFPWGTVLEVRSADHPENLVGEALDGVIMSEAAKHKPETWERFIRPALADKRGFADFPTTPEGFNWLYKLWQLGQDASIPEYESWKLPSWDNPAVYPGGRTDPEILLLERTTTYEYFMQEIGADFASFVGKIYGEFDESIHVKNHTFNPLWPNYIAFDWGFTNPLAAIEFQVAPDDTVYVWREHYRAYTRLEEHIALLKGRNQPTGYHLDLAFGDAADPEAAATVSEKLVPCLIDPMAKDNWRQGVDLVKRHLKEYEVGVADEYGTPLTRPHLYVDPGCTNLISEFNNYRAKTAPKGTNVPEMGAKIDDHALDALRYGLMHVFELGVNHHLSEVMDYAGVRGGSDESSGSMFTSGSSSDSGLFVSGGQF